MGFFSGRKTGKMSRRVRESAARSSRRKTLPRSGKRNRHRVNKNLLDLFESPDSSRSDGYSRRNDLELLDILNTTSSSADSNTANDTTEDIYTQKNEAVQITVLKATGLRIDVSERSKVYVRLKFGKN